MNAILPAHAVPRIAVVGGGITGLAAAHRLCELLPRAELALFEGSSRLGGVLDTVCRDGFLIERSADNFLTRSPSAVELCRRLGIGEELIRTAETRRRALVVRGGRLVPIPEGFFLMSPRKLWPILASPILSVAGKLRLLAEPFITRGPASQTLNPQPSTLNAHDESVASFARRRLGRETFERLVQPLVSGIYTADPEKLSMAATMPEFLDLERRNGSLLRVPGFFGSRSRSVAMAGRSNAADSASGARYSFFVAPKHGMASLIRAVGARLPAGAIHINSPAKAVRQLPGGGWHVDFGAGETSRNPQSAMQNQRMQVDAVILAVPAFAAARLVSDFAPELSAELASIEYAGSAVVSLGYRRDQIARPLDGFGFVVPQTERRRIIAGSFASEKFAGRAPANCALIRVFIGGALQSELLERTDGDLLQTAVEELRDLLGIGGEALLSDVARWPRAMPQYHVGHLERVARIEQLAARYANFALAGNAYHGVGIPQCIASAEAAAEKIAARFTELPVTLGGGG